MSIWSTLLFVDTDIYDVRYCPPGTPVRVGDGPGAAHPDDPSRPVDGFIDIASSDAWYGESGVRFTLCAEGTEVEILLSRTNAIEVVRALSGWLARTES